MTLQNNEISITVADHGAELTSIKSTSGREYLWGAYPEYWKRSSPVLFPIVGSVWQGEYRSHGATFHLGQHGIARDMDFQLVEQTDDYVEYELTSSAETLQKYPYHFNLHIGYRLVGKTVEVIWKVYNPSPTEELSFQIGAHPAFYWPLLTDNVIANGVEAMDAELAKSTNRGYFKFADNIKEIKCTVITEGGCVDKSIEKTVPVQDGWLPLDTNTFNQDALILENNQVQAVTLCDADKRPYLTLEWDAPLVGLWSPPSKNAPFVCIEPWYGRTDEVGYTGLYEQKDHIQLLAPHSTFQCKYKIIIR